jgi:hypothetical protein
LEGAVILTIKIENDAIVIRLPFETLKFASEQSPKLATYDHDKSDWRRVKVTNIQEWAKEVLRALRHEEEDGSTPVDMLFDKMFEAAVEDGAEGIAIEGVFDLDNVFAKD